MATLFDFNGVLVDDEMLHFETLRDATRPLGIVFSEQDYWDRYLGFDDRGALEAILTDGGQHADRQRIDELFGVKQRLYLQRARTELRTFPQAATVVRRAAALGTVGIVSGALRHEVTLGLEVLGVRALIAFVIAAEDAPESKPNPQGYLLALDRLRQLAEPDLGSVIVIEDSIAGVEAARAANLGCVGVAHSYPPEQLRAAGAHPVVATIAEVDAPVLRAAAERHS